MMQALATGCVCQGVCLTLQGSGDTLGSTTASKRARAGAVETDAPPAGPRNDLINSGFGAAGANRIVDTSRHHRTGLRRAIRTPSSEVAEDPAPKANPSTVIAIAHTPDGGGSLLVASRESVFILVI